MNLYDKPKGVETRWFSPENPQGQPGQGGLTNRGSKGRAFVKVLDGESFTLMDYTGSGLITRIWITIADRSPQMLRGLRIDAYWEGETTPAVSVPFGDFFGIGLGRCIAFENGLFSSPEGRSFNCFIPMPFRKSARLVITNESGTDLHYLFFDVDALVGVSHGPDMLYFHAGWRREVPNELGKEFAIVPHINASGRFLGTNIGVITDPRYESNWWGEGEVKVRIGGETHPTLCGTGTEDYIGTGWGQGFYIHRTQGCSIADKENRQWGFYRYHLDDPVYFDDQVGVSIQTMGGTSKEKMAEFQAAGVPLIPVTIDAGPNTMIRPLMDLPQPVNVTTLPESGWVNFWRQDDWSATAYLYLDQPQQVLPPLQEAADRIAGLVQNE